MLFLVPSLPLFSTLGTQSCECGFHPLMKQHGSTETAGSAKRQWISAAVRVLTDRRKENQEQQRMV